jgi:hypothetical protein
MAAAVHHLGFPLPQLSVEFFLHPVDGGVKIVLSRLSK